MAFLSDRRSAPRQEVVTRDSLKSDYEAAIQARRIAGSKIGGLSNEQAESYLAQRRTFESREDELALAFAATR